jgi:hypothetical protein
MSADGQPISLRGLDCDAQFQLEPLAAYLVPRKTGCGLYALVSGSHCEIPS